MDAVTPEGPVEGRSPSLAALLSFIWPGLGELYAGHRRLAAAFAVPALVVLLGCLWQLRDGVAILAARLMARDFAMTALLVILAVGVWRGVSVVNAFRLGTRGRSARAADRVAVAILVVAVAAMHMTAAMYAYSVYDFDRQVFSGVDDIGYNDATPGPNGETPEPAPTLPPPVTPAPESGRMTVLLTGIDSASGRSHALNDTLMVVSLDTKNRRVAMVSIPRDTSSYPFYWGGTAGPTQKINALVTYVKHGSVKSPDEPTTTLVKEVGYLIGVPVNYYAAIDLEGFAAMIDSVGGVDVVNPRAIDDPSYDWLDGKHGFQMAAGRQHLTGRLALAYVRSRHGAGDSDYTRSARQQDVLVALEQKVSSPSMALSLPDLLRQGGRMIRTNFPDGKVADVVSAGMGISADSISKCVLSGIYSIGNATPDAGVWTSKLRMDNVANLSVALFGRDSRYYGQAGVTAKACGVR